MRPEGEDEKKLSFSESCSQMGTSFANFMYSKNEDGVAVVMGRTGPSWGKISLFFFVYYACLAGFFSIIFVIAFSTMPEIKDGPKYTAFISNKPVLHVYPSGIGSYKRNKANGSIENYQKFLKGYESQNKACYDVDTCVTGDSYRPGDKEKQCRFNMSSLGPCGSDEDYGFNEGAPCFYFRLSKIYDWKPEPNSGKGNFIGIDCAVSGDSKDVTIDYYPPKDQAFPISYWPFRGESHFMLPLSAIKVHTKKKIKLQCKALGGNIELSGTWKHDKGATGKVEFYVSPPTED